MIPRLKPNFGISDWMAILQSSDGKIESFEQEFSKYFGCEYGTMYSYGRTALYVFLKILQLQNIEVICPAYTCVVVPHAIVLSQNIPVFVDCEKDSFNMSLDELEKEITPKTRVVILTHLFGYPLDIDKAEEIIRAAERKYQHKIYIINDAAHSFGAKWEGRLVTSHGDASIFGLNISKLMSSIFGGMIITNNLNLHEKLQDFQKKSLKKNGVLKDLKRLLYFISVNISFQPLLYGLVNNLERQGLLNYFVKYYSEDTIGFPKDWNHYPCPLEAKIGLSQLKKYSDIINTRCENAKKIIDSITKIPNVTCLPYKEGATYSHLVALVENRTEWVEKFRINGVQLGTLIEYSIPYMAAYKKYSRGEYPISKQYSTKTINFPIWDLKLSNKIIETLNLVIYS